MMFTRSCQKSLLLCTAYCHEENKMRLSTSFKCFLINVATHSVAYSIIKSTAIHSCQGGAY